MAFQLEGAKKDLQDWASDFGEGSRKWDFECYQGNSRIEHLKKSYLGEEARTKLKL